MSANVFFNEVHYDNIGADVGEFIEIAGTAGTNLTGWSIVFYNGSNGQSYGTISLTGTVLADQQNGYGTAGFAFSGIQNGDPDGFALIDNLGAVVQFLSYEGSFTATNGLANGATSTDIGVAESTSTTAIGASLQLKGTGTSYGDFSWAAPGTASSGSVNSGQTFGTVSVPHPGTLSVAGASVIEGDSGTSDLVFTVTRTGGSDGAVSADWTIALGTADAADLGAAQALSGTVNFADGATAAEIHVAIQGDIDAEPDETLDIALSAPTGGASLGTASATGTITNDDAAAPGATPNVWINEFHYDDISTDSGEMIEIAGRAGTSLAGWTIALYNGSSVTASTVYGTINLSGTIDDEGHGYGALAFDATGLQNGSPDGFALVDNHGTVVQLLSYEGTLTAGPGTPAAGMTSIDVGQEESNSGTPDGHSLQLTGAGASYGDFAWQPAAANSFGSLNAGQTIIGDNETGQLSIGDASVQEGDAGTTDLVFTVHRAGGLGLSGGVDYAVVLDGSAGSDDLAPTAQLSGHLDFAPGDSSATINVQLQGDLLGEANETFSVVLANATGDVAITDASATGTITNDDPVAVAIYAIQGAGHMSALVDQVVSTQGIVTAVDSNGFYIQDATGDGDAATSDAIFVYTGGAPTADVAVGNLLVVNGTVSEFAADPLGLTVTEIIAPNVALLSTGHVLPDAVLIGSGGLLPPSEVIDDDGLTSYDPLTDGIDFWESLEGMRVTLDTPLVVSNTNQHGETDVVASLGAGATGVNDRGGITISSGDYNPEKIQIDDDSGIFAGFTPDYTIGDQLSSVTGIVNYAFNTYEVLVTEAVSLDQDVTLPRETTALGGDDFHLSIATYNVENLDVSDNKFDILGNDIVYNLNAPDIIALQEIQDADGAGSGSDLSGTVTAQGLIDAIYAASGLTYAYVEVAPTVANTSGGEPNGNIRSGFLYNVDRVDYVDSSAVAIEGDAYTNSRKPLVASFQFGGETITLIDVHFYSRGGSDPLWGANQPPIDSGDTRRTDQAAGVKAYVNDHLADDPDANYVILGDWNGFYWEQAQLQLTDPLQGGVFTNLSSLLPTEERYSYIFEGNAQEIDHILVTDSLLAGAQYDAVHLNSQYGGTRPTDHDPQVALLSFVPDHTLDFSDETGATYVNLASDSALDGNGASVDASGILNVIGSDYGDTIVGEAGTGTLWGGGGDDSYLVSDAGTVIVEHDGEGKDSVTTTLAAFVLPDEVENLAHSGPGNFAGTGNALDNLLVGGTGDDTFDGGLGMDTMVGGSGNDIYWVDNVGDLPSESSARGGNDTVLTTLHSYTLGNFLDNLLFVGTGDFTGTGNTLANKLTGGSGADTLDGGSGNDTLTGGAGADAMMGGSGVDIFVFKPGDFGTGGVNDVIGDFAGDKIDLTAIDVNSALPGVQHLTFIAGNAFTGVAGQLHYVSTDDGVLLEGDLDGNGAADFAIDVHLSGGAHMMSAGSLLL